MASVFKMSVVILLLRIIYNSKGPVLGQTDEDPRNSEMARVEIAVTLGRECGRTQYRRLKLMDSSVNDARHFISDGKE
jgi:hypothetical protein